MPRAWLLASLMLSLVACWRDGLDAEAMRDPAACASCHPDHYREWSGSVHAYASDDPVFLALDRLGQRSTNGALGSLCVGCHAPTALALGLTTDGTDLDAVPRALRGVGCWACHAIDGVTAVHNGALTRSDDGVMRGGIADPVDTPAHASERSRLLDGGSLVSSDACGACHDVLVGAVAVESTYREWAGSVVGPTGRAPLSCATCHMIGRDGPAAALPGMPTRRVHDHQFPGIDQPLIPWPESDRLAAGIARDLQAALSARLCVTATGGGVAAEVTLENVQAGHAFPSGVTHSRRVWVELVASAGDQVVFASGRFAPGEVVSAARDPSLWLLSSRFIGADGGTVEVPWEVAAIDSALLPPAVTVDPLDPRYYHAKARTYDVLGAVDRVELAVHVEPIGLDQLDALIAAGELDPAVRAAMPRLTLPTLTRRWDRAAGYGCVR